MAWPSYGRGSSLLNSVATIWTGGRRPRTTDDLNDHDLIGYDVETPAIQALVQR
jgi:hypothetical protein